MHYAWSRTWYGLYICHSGWYTMEQNQRMRAMLGLHLCDPRLQALKLTAILEWGSAWTPKNTAIRQGKVMGVGMCLYQQLVQTRKISSAQAGNRGTCLRPLHIFALLCFASLCFVKIYYSGRHFLARFLWWHIISKQYVGNECCQQKWWLMSYHKL